MAASGRINWHDVWIELRGVLIGLLVALGVRAQFQPAIYFLGCGFAPGYRPPGTPTDVPRGEVIAAVILTMYVAPLLGGAIQRILTRSLWPALPTAIAYGAIVYATGGLATVRVGDAAAAAAWGLWLSLIGSLVVHLALSARGVRLGIAPTSGWMARLLQAIAGTALIRSPFAHFGGVFAEGDRLWWVSWIVRGVYVAICVGMPSRWRKLAVRTCLAGLALWWIEQRLDFTSSPRPLEGYLVGLTLFALASEAETTRERVALWILCGLAAAGGLLAALVYGGPWES